MITFEHDNLCPKKLQKKRFNLTVKLELKQVQTLNIIKSALFFCEA